MGASKVKVRATDEGEVDLSMSDLEEVPIKELTQLKKVYDLDLSNNRLAVLPKTFPCLVNLTKLDLSKNELSLLPDDFGDLVKLRHLDLYSNKLQRLPSSFGQLKDLKWLDLKDNDLVPILAKVAGPCAEPKDCQQCAKDIVAFFQKINTDLEERVRVKKIELEAQERKQEQKRAKKKEKKKQKQETVVVQTKKAKSVEKIRSVKAEPEIVAQKKLPSPKSYSKFKFFLFLLILTSGVLFVSTSVKLKCTERVEHAAKVFFNFCLDKVPENFRYLGVNLGNFVHDSHLRTGQVALRLGAFVNEYIPQSKRDQLCDAFRSSLRFCVEKIKEIYNNFKQ